VKLREALWKKQGNIAVTKNYDEYLQRKCKTGVQKRSRATQTCGEKQILVGLTPEHRFTYLMATEVCLGRDMFLV
jgi:hypothetical protein